MFHDVFVEITKKLLSGILFNHESFRYRYELCFAGEKLVKATPATQAHDSGTEKSQNHHPHSANGEKSEPDHVMIDAFRWSRCKKPLPQKLMRTIGIPLPLEHVEVFLYDSSFHYKYVECIF